MNKKLLKKIFPFIAFALLIPWPVAYGFDASGASNSQEPIQITAAEISAQPTWTGFGKAISGVTAGDLFYIDATNNPADIKATLYLTNAEELVPTYKYLILKIGFYSKLANGDWQKVTEYNGNSIPDYFITMGNGRVSFNLPGSDNYKITIDDGSFNCYGAADDEGSASPKFYLEIE